MDSAVTCNRGRPFVFADKAGPATVWQIGQPPVYQARGIPFEIDDITDIDDGRTGQLLTIESSGGNDGIAVT
jgi:hypothetical protein